MNIQLAYYYINGDHEAKPLISHQSATPNTNDFGQQRWFPLLQLIRQTISNTPKAQIIEEYDPDLADGKPRVIILLTDNYHLTISETLNKLVPDKITDVVGQGNRLRYVNFEKDHRNSSWVNRMCPILTIGVEDFSELYADKSSAALTKHRYLYKLGFDHRIKFLDSSIWHRYIPLNSGFLENFLKILTQTIRNFEDGLYASYVSLTTLEFQTRAMLNSYICEVGENGHGEVVTPFKFHSESAMGRAAEDIFHILNGIGYGDKKLFDVVRWRLLLIDDYASKHLHVRRYPFNTKVSVISKKNLILNLLNQKFATYEPLSGIDTPADSDELVFKIKEVTQYEEGLVEDSIKMLRSNMYDVLLLDYLLSEHQGNGRGGREYGYDFLHEIENQIRCDIHPDRPIRKGPLGRFWVFPTSSFPFAFTDKLHQLGMDGYSDHWHLSGGGEPITTPELFRYRFLNFVKQQVDECCLYETTLSNFFQRFAGITHDKSWREACQRSVERYQLNQQMLESDREAQSEFGRTMRTFIRTDPYFVPQLEALRIFLRQIDRISYYDLHRYIDDIPQLPEMLRNNLSIKCKSLFFTSEFQCEQEISKHPSHDTTFQFQGKLRWLPRNIGTLTHLTVLRLNRKDLLQIPDELERLIRLEEIDLSDNQLSFIPPFVYKFPNLWYLNLRGNPGLDSELQQEFEHLNRIKALVSLAKQAPRKCKYIFISYAHKDRDLVNKIKNIFERLRIHHNVDYFMDSMILPGEKWDKRINDALEQSEIFLPLVSHNFLASEYIESKELKIALQREKDGKCKVMPLMLDIPLSALPHKIQLQQAFIGGKILFSNGRRCNNALLNQFAEELNNIFR